MKRKIVRASIFAMLFGAILLGTPFLRAHDNFRIIGNISGLTGTKLSVESKDNKTFVIALRGDTGVWRDKQKVAASELKVGVSVVVDAWGDSERDLEALEITITPSPKPSK